MFGEQNIEILHEALYILSIAVPAVLGTFYTLNYVFKWFNSMISGKLTIDSFEKWIKDHEKKHDTFETSMTIKIERIESNSHDLKDYVSAMAVKTTTTLETMLQLFGMANKKNN